MENKNKSVGLVRVSSHTQDDIHGGTGLQFQRDKILQYSKLHDIELLDILSDVCKFKHVEKYKSYYG